MDFDGLVKKKIKTTRRARSLVRGAQQQSTPKIAAKVPSGPNFSFAAKTSPKAAVKGLNQIYDSRPVVNNGTNSNSEAGSNMKRSE